MEQVGVELPVVVGQAHQFHGEDGRNRAGVVEYQVHLPVADAFIEEPVRGLLHERLHLLDGPRGEERGKGVSQGQVVGPVDLADAQGGLAFGAGDAHLALVVHAVGGVRFVFVRESGVVSGGVGHGFIAAQEPETAVILVPGDRTLPPKLGVDHGLVEVELVGMVIEVDNRVGADVGACSHRKVLQHNDISCTSRPAVG